MIIWVKLVQIVSNWIKLVQIESNWIKSHQFGYSWFKMVQNCSKLFKLKQDESDWSAKIWGWGICLVIVDYWKTWLKLVMLENLQACFILTWPQFPSLWIQLTPFAEQQPLWISAFKKFVCFEDLFIFFVCARVDWVTVFSCLYQPYELQW